jgi:UDP-glucose 4-epimerase
MLILVTGARGAIGRAVVREGARRGHRVIGVGHGAWTGDADLPPLDGWWNSDLDVNVLSVIAHAKGVPDAVIHLAGGSQVGASITHPGEDFRRTVVSGQNLLEWVRLSAPATRVVIASTAAVYGDAHAGPIPEDASPAPKSPYGVHKAVVEMLAVSYGREFGVSSVMLRLFSAYGPGLRKQLIWDLAGRLLRGERRLVLGGTGEERRDFVHIDDAAALLLDAAALASPDAPVFNCGSGRAISVREAAGLIARGFPGTEIEFTGEARPGDPFSLVSDTRRAAAAGLRVTTPFEDGLADTMAWIERAGAAR